MDSGFLLGSSTYASLLGVPVPEDVAEREERAWKLEQVREERGWKLEQVREERAWKLEQVRDPLSS